MEYGICTVAAAPVRKEASHRSEMVNQLLFGETMEILEEKDEWLRIRTVYDQYEGWLTNHLISAIDQSTALEDVSFIASSLTNPITLPDQLINAPMGAPLVGYDEETRLLWDDRYKYHGSFRKTGRPFDPDFLRKTIQAWLNAPYLWGGKTYMGVDCSGFVQTVYRLLGIKLPRDAWQQAERGDIVEHLSESRTGDLAFFSNDQQRIVHVGIILDGNEIAHASGKVRIDTLTEKGIWQRESGRKTHSLHVMKRYF
ncbi:MAG TPA: C40 family peptidase [Flavisolibacter sp.]|nr:C40 family peptidase [Flavisolibacter sp.]